MTSDQQMFTPQGHDRLTVDPLNVIEAEASQFAEVLQRTDPDATVPSCPGWRARDLLKHLIEVHDFWAAVMGDRLTGEHVGQYQESRTPLTDDVDELFRQRAEATGRLLTALRSREPHEAAWSWFEPDQTVDFTLRMQTHEATVHRVDAELAAGVDLSPIAAPVAAAGIDHVIDVMWNWVPTEAKLSTGPAASSVVELRATDGSSDLIELYRWTGEAWGQAFTDQIGARRALAGSTPVATVSGPAMQLDLLVWSRPAEVTRSGDSAALAEFEELIALGIQ